MKKKNIDVLHDRVCALCVHLRDDTGFLMHLNDLLYGVIELARTGKTVQALGVAREVASYLAEGHSHAVRDARQKAWAESVKAQPGSRIGIVGDKNVWWKAGEVNIRTTQPSVACYVGIRHDAPKPVATVEQMRAAADAAMNDHIGWFVCTGCGKKTATADGKGPIGWVFNAEVDGEVYKALCATCFGTGILKDYECNVCGQTTSSRQHPPPHWVDDEENDGHLCSSCQETP